jgi:hypothetical protein
LGTMKTTIEMSDSLVTELKVMAAREHRRLRDVMEEVVALGLRARREAQNRESSAARADTWLADWATLGQRVRDASVDSRTLVEIVIDERR